MKIKLPSGVIVTYSTNTELLNILQTNNIKDPVLFMKPKTATKPVYHGTVLEVTE